MYIQFLQQIELMSFAKTLGNILNTFKNRVMKFMVQANF
jgi:hypothetical protein